MVTVWPAAVYHTQARLNNGILLTQIHKTVALAKSMRKGGSSGCGTGTRSWDSPIFSGSSTRIRQTKAIINAPFTKQRALFIGMSSVLHSSLALLKHIEVVLTGCHFSIVGSDAIGKSLGLVLAGGALDWELVGIFDWELVGVLDWGFVTSAACHGVHSSVGHSAAGPECGSLNDGRGQTREESRTLSLLCRRRRSCKTLTVMKE